MSAVDPDDPEQQAIIYTHGRTDIRGCHCGWAEPGKSHAAHVLTVLRDHLVAADRGDARNEAERCRKFDFNTYVYGQADGYPCVLRAGHSGPCSLGKPVTS